MEITLNDTGYISSPEGQKSLQLQDTKQQSNFELGVSMAIYKWDTLATAVENNWGGPQSAEKRDWITGLVIDLFAQQKELDIIYIHEVLFNAMEDEFDVVVEDQSTVIVAQNIIKIYKQCKENNFAIVHNLYERFLQKENYRKTHGLNSQKVQVGEDPSNPNVSDDDDDEEEDDDDDEDMMDVDDDVPQLVLEHKKQEPVVDDDGFTVVSRKRR
ncbi:unnamed protein product [Ambrosiozyma monospora]|uniref:Unnamed protein product n=1 Tax=Ambrosiozyma monospora TaxID=43982 RepID=A0ACB5T7I4_AMBMO|nr:unnamed protein product [Ambrosiozyma monospora]